jgi:glucose-1-phosphatase
VPSAKFRAIIFDIGRVLIHVDISRAMVGLASDLTLTAQEAWSVIEKDPRWPDWQEGRMSPQDWYLHLTKRLGSALTFDQFTEVWNSALDPEPIQSELFLEKLSRNYRLALLSNTDPIHMSREEERFPFFRFFPTRIYSYRVGASKPNPLIYREALRTCKVRAEEAIYIDDVPAYAQAAQRLGMTGVVFQTPEQLQTDLRNLGVNLDRD